MCDKQRTRSARRRRRISLGALGGFAVGAFALGAALGDGPAPRPSAAERLTASQLAGQRIVLGFPAAEPPAGVRRTIRAGRVAATAKHFPGLGSARLNTDDAVQRIGLSKRTLRDVDEAPYRRFAARGGELVMLSTAIYPAFSTKPAAFSRAIATGELRRRLGFEGVSITDALDPATGERPAAC